MLGKIKQKKPLFGGSTVFQDDLYIEIMRHNQEDENRVNSCSDVNLPINTE